MKILVADDDVVARKVLGAFLQQSSYEMVAVADSASAYRALTAPDGPQIAILDWMMPDFSGPELCCRLRQHPFAIQPYLIVLTNKKEKSDLATALDAGADDFLTKPFNITETQARLRVGIRAIELQCALLGRITALEEQQRAAAPAVATPVATAAASLPPAPEEIAPAPVRAELLDRHQFDTVVAGALRHAGLYDAPRRQARAGSGALSPIGWAAILLPKRALWIDLLMEIAPADLTALFTRVRGRAPAQPGELVDFSTTLQTALRDSMQSVLRAMGNDVMIPLPPRAVGGVSLPALPTESIERHRYKIGGTTVTILVVVQENPLRAKETSQLQTFDVLAQPYPPAEQQRVPLLRAGVVLNDHYVDKLRDFTSSIATDVPPVAVHTPSPLAQHYSWEISAEPCGGAVR